MRCRSRASNKACSSGADAAGGGDATAATAPTAPASVPAEAARATRVGVVSSCKRGPPDTRRGATAGRIIVGVAAAFLVPESLRPAACRGAGVPPRAPAFGRRLDRWLVPAMGRALACVAAGAGRAAFGGVPAWTIASSGASCESTRCGASVEASTPGVARARLTKGGSTKATNLRVTLLVQPSVTETVSTGSSIKAVEVTRTLRWRDSVPPSSVTRIWPGWSLLSPENTSAATHSRASVSAASRFTAAAKFSGWPSWVVLMTRPNPRACAEGTASAAMMAIRVEAARMRRVGLGLGAEAGAGAEAESGSAAAAGGRKAGAL